jgi:hypothetical protein
VLWLVSAIRLNYKIRVEFDGHLLRFPLFSRQSKCAVVPLYFHGAPLGHRRTRTSGPIGMVDLLIFCDSVEKWLKRRLPTSTQNCINGSFRRHRWLFCLLRCSGSKMPSNPEIFYSAPNFDARVRSTAFLHQQNQTPRTTCFLNCGSLVLSLVESIADVRYDLWQEGPRKQKLE